MTATAFTTFRPTDSTGLLFCAGAFVQAYCWAQAVARVSARTNDVGRSVSETGEIV